MKRILLIILIFLGAIQMKAQDLTFTFANAQITNDGSDYYYDVDVMIQSTIDFKLGSGQLYLTYNKTAFGDNVSANSNLVYSQPSGAILAEQYSIVPAYKDFIQNDNTISRVSLAFQQGLSAGAITANNVTSTPRVLFHVRIKFIDVNADPMVAFETGAVYLDQFYTACGQVTNDGFADCSTKPGVQLFNDTFDSSNSVDTTAPMITLTGNNPQEIEIGSGYSELGATTDDGSKIIIDSSEFIDAIGTYTIYYNATDIVGNTATQVTRTINVVPVLSTEDVSFDKVTLYPNPVKNYFQILGVSKELQITIYTISGQEVSKALVTNTDRISINELSDGVYFVKVMSDGIQKTFKLAKN
ncbi:T9SS type A sorting domain-containing protein [Aquimarina sp. 2201CG5-10]|uniref:T9SS type A sorting domain-containing protein n=1 Tax=Aquimarina callyspongiae TaxID=3098150 RepID=UPI002AB490CB|nr:T9SS type A sorting domain-containing protein [Aquimarina sp. 2201CG5-10]MDY8138026.1 T9SS type A sorting domain-containing protein [Aquimarina sp. 2201CG5-10]